MKASATAERIAAAVWEADRNGSALEHIGGEKLSVATIKLSDLRRIKDACQSSTPSVEVLCPFSPPSQ